MTVSIRLIIVVVTLLTAVTNAVQASVSADLEKSLKHAVGEDRIAVLIKHYKESLLEEDAERQQQFLRLALEEAERQRHENWLSKIYVERVQFFYNNGMSDSVLHYVPEYKKTLAHAGQWDQYYELWGHMVNTLIYFSESKQDALREVQSMFDDAMGRDSKYGMGIAYYAMGNVYMNMNNLDQSEDAYRKGLGMLSSVSPLPGVMADLYSYYGDVLNEQKKYRQLDSLTVEWREFIPRFLKEQDLDNGKEDKAMADILWFYYYIACVQAALGQKQLERTEQMLDEARAHFGQYESYQGMAWMFCKSQLCLEQGRLPEALLWNDRRLALTVEGEDKAIYLTVIAQRAEILQKMGRYELSSEIYRQMYILKDSISNADTRKQLNEMNTMFKVGELERERDRTLYSAIIAIVVLVLLALGIFTVFRVRSARKLAQAHGELLVAYDQLEETTKAKERIESDLRIARDIQMGMVPRVFPDRPDLDLFATMTPAKEVGGDLYAYVLIGDNLYFALGDVSGKGVPASLFMAQATRLFRTLAAQQLSPPQIAMQINDALSGEDNETSMFVTMFIGLLDLTTGHLDFCNAGHNPPVIMSVEDGVQPEFLEMIPNCPIGLWPGFEYEGESVADISNRPLFVYTDGLNEAENRQQEQFSDERLLEVLHQTHFESSRKTIELLSSMVEQHRDGAEPNDDLTMLCVLMKREATN